MTPWTIARQAPLSMEFSRQEYRCGSHSLLLAIFPTQGSDPGLLHCKQILYHLSYQGSPTSCITLGKILNLCWAHFPSVKWSSYSTYLTQKTGTKDSESWVLKDPLPVTLLTCSDEAGCCILSASYRGPHGRKLRWHSENN